MGVASDPGHDPSHLAAELHAARLQRSTVASITSRYPGFSADDGYVVQAAGIELRVAEGETIIGGKLGFTSLAMRRAMGVDSPNYGWLTDVMLVHDHTVRLDGLIHPKVEPEIAFLLDADLGARAIDRSRGREVGVEARGLDAEQIFEGIE